MANTAHLFRRQSSRDLNSHGSHRDYTKTLDELELKVVKWKIEFFLQFFTFNIFFVSIQRLKEKLVRADSVGGRGPLYGATNQAFNSDDVLVGRHYKPPALLEIFEEPTTFHSTVSIPAATAAEEKLQPPIKDDDIVADDNHGEERESWDSKITFLLATIG